jgi:hypothetical protein
MSFYSAEQLLNATRTLYGTHLIRDGKVLWDECGTVAAIMAQLEPADADVLLRRVKELAVGLDASSTELGQHLEGLTRLARYLLRTAIYAVAMRQGQPCFSVRELAVRFKDPELATLLASDPSIFPPTTAEGFSDLRDRLSEVVGPLPHHPYGSLQALAIHNWDSDRILAAVRVPSEFGRYSTLSSQTAWSRHSSLNRSGRRCRWALHQVNRHRHRLRPLGRCVRAAGAAACDRRILNVLCFPFSEITPSRSTGTC